MLCVSDILTLVFPRTVNCVALVLVMELDAQVFSSEDILALSQSDSLGDGDDSKDEDYFPSSEDTKSTFSEFSQVSFEIVHLSDK